MELRRDLSWTLRFNRSQQVDFVSAFLDLYQNTFRMRRRLRKQIPADMSWSLFFCVVQGSRRPTALRLRSQDEPIVNIKIELGEAYPCSSAQPQTPPGKG